MKTTNSVLRYSALLVMGLLATGCSGMNSTLTPLTVGAYATQPDTVSIVLKNYVAQPGNQFQNIFVSNYSVKVSNGTLSLSSSRDSMSDTMKTSLNSTYGFNLGYSESVVTGFADLLLYDLGITTSQQSLMHCATNQTLSTSNDALIYNDDRQNGDPVQFLGLRDCEKVYMGLKPTLFDNAGNGIPDYLKLRCGINPTDKNAAYVSAAGDGVSNLDKCKRNIPIDEEASTQPNTIFAYHYNTQLNGDGTTDLTISNIPILNGGAENFIALYVVETNLSSSTSSLYSSYAILKAGYAGKTLSTPYWAVSPSTLVNQEISVP